jgi:hypothetical protein
MRSRALQPFGWPEKADLDARMPEETLLRMPEGDRRQRLHESRRSDSTKSGRDSAGEREKAMPIIEIAGGNLTPAPEGAHAAVCVDVIDLGMVEDTSPHEKPHTFATNGWPRRPAADMASPEFQTAEVGKQPPAQSAIFRRRRKSEGAPNSR